MDLDEAQTTKKGNPGLVVVSLTIPTARPLLRSRLYQRPGTGNLDSAGVDLVLAGVAMQVHARIWQSGSTPIT